MYQIFDGEILRGLCKINAQKIQEIRLRVNRFVKVVLSGKEYFLTPNGISYNSNGAISITSEEIAKIVMRSADYSIYAVNDNIVKGFLTLKNSIRIGLCGEGVENNGKIKTFKNFTSLIIRFPHEIKSCGTVLLTKLKDLKKDFSVLISSPPGGGKTTILRDCARILSQEKNTLIVDERYEIASQNETIFGFDVGDCDVISGCSKQIAIENAVRSCAPNYIVTDEISVDDYNCIKLAKTCGLNLFTTIHAQSVDDLLKKDKFDTFINGKIFDFYVFLSDKRNPGKVVGIFNDLFGEIV